MRKKNITKPREVNYVNADVEKEGLIGQSEDIDN